MRWNGLTHRNESKAAKTTLLSSGSATTFLIPSVAMFVTLLNHSITLVEEQDRHSEDEEPDTGERARTVELSTAL